MNDVNRRRERVYAEWVSRSEEERAPKHTERFSAEMWSSGLRLDKREAIHYQRVMDTIRSKVS